VTEPLFDLPPVVVPPKLSSTEKLTIKNRALIANGYNPASRLALADNGETCGTCAHHVVHLRNKVWHKCDLRFTFGPGTDLRISWPACVKWEPAP